GQPPRARLFNGSSPFTLLESFPVKINQFHRGHRGFESLVSLLSARAIDSLLQRIGGDETVNDWHSGLHSSLGNALGHLAGDVVKMWSLSPDNCANTNHCIKLSRFRHFQSQQRNLKRSGHFVNFDCVIISAEAV